MTELDYLAFNIMRMIWLLQALLCQGLLLLAKKNPDLELLLQQGVTSGWMMFYQGNKLFIGLICIVLMSLVNRGLCQHKSV